MRRFRQPVPPAKYKPSGVVNPDGIKVLLVLNQPGLAGVRSSMLGLHRELTNRGCNVIVIGSRAGSPVVAADVNVRSKVTPFCDWADVIVCHGRTAKTIRRCTPKPIVVWLHGFGAFLPRDWKLWGEGGGVISLLLGNSQFTIKSLQQAAGVLYPPFSEYKTERGECITMVNLTSRKQPQVFHHLARKFPDRKFLAVKGGWGRQDIPQKLPPNVTVVGTTSDMGRDVYSKTRILLMPSPTETFGLVGVEAMTSGIPVIAGTSPGSRESLGAAGVFLNPQELQAWEKEIQKLDNPDYYKERSDKSLQRAEELKDISGRQLDKFSEQLHQMAGRVKPAAAVNLSWWETIRSLQDTPSSAAGRPSINTRSVAKTAIITGNVIIGEGSKVDHYAIIEGPVRIGKNCIIGSFAKIRAGAQIADNVLIGSYTEVKTSIIKEGAKIGPLCFIGDSYVSEGVFLGASVRTSNYMLRDKPIRVMDGDKLIEVNMKKLGCFIGENVAIGIETVILPGRRVEADKTVLPLTLFTGNALDAGDALDAGVRG